HDPARTYEQLSLDCLNLVEAAPDPATQDRLLQHWARLAGRLASPASRCLSESRTAARLSWQKLDRQSGGIVNVYMPNGLALSGRRSSGAKPGCREIIERSLLYVLDGLAENVSAIEDWCRNCILGIK